MARAYSSYLVRCWATDDGAARIEVEHIQSGARTRVASLPLAAAWIDARARAEAARADAAAEPGPSPDGQGPEGGVR